MLFTEEMLDSPYLPASFDKILIVSLSYKQHIKNQTSAAQKKTTVNQAALCLTADTHLSGQAETEM